MRRFLTLILLLCAAFSVQSQQVVFSNAEKPIADSIRGLRALPDARRPLVTKQLALDIRALKDSPNRLLLASSLANLATEGDPGLPTLQEVAATLAAALKEQAASARQGMPEEPYVTLAQLVRYEGARIALDDPLLKTAMTRLQAEEMARQSADFTLKDTSGKPWTLHDLRGKVVFVNFWATWCPPCRKEMPDIQALYERFRGQGLVVLAISDEEPAKVNPFIAEGKYTYPILLDPGDKVMKMMSVDGIPKSFVYDREGKLVAQAIDMRTRRQFLEMLGKAGLR